MVKAKAHKRRAAAYNRAHGAGASELPPPPSSKNDVPRSFQRMMAVKEALEPKPGMPKKRSRNKFLNQSSGVNGALERQARSRPSPQADVASGAMSAEAFHDPTLPGHISEGSDWSDSFQEAQAPIATSPPPAAGNEVGPHAAVSQGLLNVIHDAHPQQPPEAQHAASPQQPSKPVGMGNNKSKPQSTAEVLGGARGVSQRRKEFLKARRQKMKSRKNRKSALEEEVEAEAAVLGFPALEPGFGEQAQQPLKLKHIRQKSTPSAALHPAAANGGRHQKLFLQQLEHAQQQQQQSQKATASLQASSHRPATTSTPPAAIHPAVGHNGMKLKQKAKHKLTKPGGLQPPQRDTAGPSSSSEPQSKSRSLKDEQQLQQHRKLMSMEALRRREESRSAWVQAYRDAKQRGGVKRDAAGATSASLARMVAGGSHS
ncbi:hypothetical protein WJX74_002823 [Apatococcus lobatus]|uniref:Uncharacterized protein n=1 Tax=Apatococcus lobatus TaxID=904363 RepID=A0AAW1QIY3_9CHLO